MSIVEAVHQSCLIVLTSVLHQTLDLLPDNLIKDLSFEGEADHLVETAHKNLDVGGILNLA